MVEELELHLDQLTNMKPFFSLRNHVLLSPFVLLVPVSKTFTHSETLFRYAKFLPSSWNCFRLVFSPIPFFLIIGWPGNSVTKYLTTITCRYSSYYALYALAGNFIFGGRKINENSENAMKAQLLKKKSPSRCCLLVQNSNFAKQVTTFRKRI